MRSGKGKRVREWERKPKKKYQNSNFGRFYCHCSTIKISSFGATNTHNLTCALAFSSFSTLFSTFASFISVVVVDAAEAFCWCCCYCYFYGLCVLSPSYWNTWAPFVVYSCYVGCWWLWMYVCKMWMRLCDGRWCVRLQSIWISMGLCVITETVFLSLQFSFTCFSLRM